MHKQQIIFAILNCIITKIENNNEENTPANPKVILGKKNCRSNILINKSKLLKKRKYALYGNSAGKYVCKYCNKWKGAYKKVEQHERICQFAFLNNAAKRKKSKKASQNI